MKTTRRSAPKAACIAGIAVLTAVSCVLIPPVIALISGAVNKMTVGIENENRDPFYGAEPIPKKKK